MKAMLTLCLFAGVLVRGHAATTIDPANSMAHGANTGWIDWRGDVSHGARIGEYVCSGSIYAANVGWINLGDGSPSDGIRYQNNSASDYGVNNLGDGRLRGRAYGANIGWLSFEDTGAPGVNLKTGEFTGYVWSANCGWISLSNTLAHVATKSIESGTDSDGDGIADAYEFTHSGGLGSLTATGDRDGDGVSDVAEAAADTNPVDPDDYLQILRITHGLTSPADTALSWTSQPTRCYAVEHRPGLEPSSSWSELLVVPTPGADHAEFTESADQHFYRIRAIRPLSP